LKSFSLTHPQTNKQTNNIISTVKAKHIRQEVYRKNESWMDSTFHRSHQGKNTSDGSGVFTEL